MLPTDSEFTVERFCSHHDTASFICEVEEAEFKEALAIFKLRFVNGFPDILFVSTPDSRLISGYFAVHETYLYRISHRRRFLYLTHLAVSLPYRGTEVMGDLVSKAYHLWDTLQSAATEIGEPYYGVIIDSHGDEEIERMLHAHGYTRMAAKRKHWWTRNPRNPRSG